MLLLAPRSTPPRHDSTRLAKRGLNGRPWRPVTYNSGAILISLLSTSARCEERASTSAANWEGEKKRASQRDEGFLESAVCPHTVKCCYKDIRAKSRTPGLRTGWQLLVISRKWYLTYCKKVKQPKAEPDGSWRFVCNVMRIPS